MCVRALVRAHDVCMHFTDMCVCEAVCRGGGASTSEIQFGDDSTMDVMREYSANEIEIHMHTNTHTTRQNTL